MKYKEVYCAKSLTLILITLLISSQAKEILKNNDIIDR